MNKASNELDDSVIDVIEYYRRNNTQWDVNHIYALTRAIRTLNFIDDYHLNNLLTRRTINRLETLSSRLTRVSSLVQSGKVSPEQASTYLEVRASIEILETLMG